MEIGQVGLVYNRSCQTFFLNREVLGAFLSLFSLEGHVTHLSKSFLSLLGRPI